MSRPPCIADTPLPYPHAESQFMLVRGARPWTTAGIYMSAVLNVRGAEQADAGAGARKRLNPAAPSRVP